MAVGVFEDFATRGIWRFVVDLRCLHGRRIDHRSVAAGMRQPHRIVRRNLAECVVHGEALHIGLWRFIPFRLMKTAPHDPSAGLGGFGGGGHHGHNVIPIACRPQIEVHLRLAHSHEVTVSFDKPRYRQSAAQINYLCGGTFQSRAFCACTNGDDSAITNGDGVDLRLGWIKCDDFAIAQY